MYVSGETVYNHVDLCFIHSLIVHNQIPLKSGVVDVLHDCIIATKYFQQNITVILYFTMILYLAYVLRVILNVTHSIILFQVRIQVKLSFGTWHQ